MKKYLVSILVSSTLIFTSTSSALEIAAVQEGKTQVLFNQPVTESTTFTIQDPCALISAMGGVGSIQLQFTSTKEGPEKDAPNIKVKIPNVYDNPDGVSFIADPSPLYLKDSTPAYSKISRNPPNAFGDSCGIAISISLEVISSKK